MLFIVKSRKSIWITDYATNITDWASGVVIPTKEYFKFVLTNDNCNGTDKKF
jgi:hypothetical protein